MANILILSVGTRNKIVQYFKQTVTEAGIGRIITTDMSEFAPALYEGDRHYIVPGIKDPSYISKILDICRREEVEGLLSLIDPELGLLADHEEEFKALGVKIIGSGKDLCDLALDKMEMYRWLVGHGYLAAKSYINKDDFYADQRVGKIGFPVFVKPVQGSASLSISKVDNKEVLDLLFEQGKNLMIQEFLDGQELGADVYIDLLSGEVVSIFVKKKLLMRAGETDKSVSYKNEDLFVFIEKFVKEIGFLGQIDIDIFEIDGKFYVSEVNPRFGGGYPHAYEAGVDHMQLIVNNLRGKANSKKIGDYEEGIYMMKYNEIMVKQVEK